MADELSGVGDGELEERLARLVREEREKTAAVVRALAELDRRGLALRKGHSSLYAYALKVLGYAEGAAYRRATAARLLRPFPAIRGLLGQGRIHLEAVKTLAPHLNRGNQQRLLEGACGKTQREVEGMLAAEGVPVQIRDTMRRLPGAPAPSVGSAVDNSTAPSPPVVRFAFTATETLFGRVRRVREILWHKYPDGKLGDVFGEVTEFFLDKKDPDRRVVESPPVPAPAGQSRRIPQWVRDVVWRRDGGRCAYTAVGGTRCETRAGLEFDHVKPWARGGPSDDPANVRLLCRAHNGQAARDIFG